ncbi:unnamed protein product [Darwinula stevensoni]|uniref:Peptidase M13 N-terminal domain-containing protein n=1 Tax=Darwinula stevensoni TaxID=69355 RepID=A0A7R9A4I2_9CRUS|nr:unnamed protein product [Darwinula stevensoni]CAG0890073.1 unnamed protein product [Darwinula stevensoni]
MLRLSAEEILSNMDPKEDPCNDFYRYTCGRFVDKAIIPDGESWVSQFTKIDYQLKKDLRHIVEKPIGSGELPAFRVVKTMYASCMNQSQINLLGLDVLKDVLDRIGGWPVVLGSEWNDLHFTWSSLMYEYRKMGFSIGYFIEFSVAGDMKNSSRNILKIDQPTLGLDRVYLMKGLDDDVVQAYYDYMAKLAILLGAAPDRAQLELREVLQFQILLANYLLPNEERRNSTNLYNKMTITELRLRWPSIPWHDYVNEMLAPFHNVTPEEPVNIVAPAYIDKFVGALEITPKR